MRKPAKPKSEIIKDLAAVFRTYGFHGATLSKLTEGVSLERASLYHYFPKGKADMAQAVLLQALEELQRSVIGSLKEDLPAKSRIQKMLKEVEKFYSGGNEICFITIFSLGEKNVAITEETRTAVKVWLKFLGKALEEMGKTNYKELAQYALSSIQGSLILSHTLNDTQIFKNCLKEMQENLL